MTDAQGRMSSTGGERDEAHCDYEHTNIAMRRDDKCCVCVCVCVRLHFESVLANLEHVSEKRAILCDLVCSAVLIHYHIHTHIHITSDTCTDVSYERVKTHLHLLFVFM